MRPHAFVGEMRKTMGFLSKLLTFGEGKQLKRYQSLVDKIGSLEPSMQALTDAELVALTAAYKERAANGESLTAFCPRHSPRVREAGQRVMGMRHFDVQLIGACAS